MSLFGQISSAFADIQGQLAQAQGMAAGGTNVVFRGAALVGTWGPPRVTEVMNAAGGYRRRSEITLTVTKAQITTAPDSKEQIIRTDLDPNVTYRIDVIENNDPHHWVFNCIRVGE